MKVLEVNNIDLIGRRFNGYDFIDNSSFNDIQIEQSVIIKQSNNERVHKLFENKNINDFYNLSEMEEKELALHSVISISSPALIESKPFKECDIVHFHMFHNTRLSLYSLIEISRQKKVIISLHDPWFFTGHCVHFQDCDGWLNHCRNCPDLNRLFKLNWDNANDLWKLKKNVFDIIDVDLIVSSPWMYDLAKKSPITKNKRIHLIPFGVDTNLFKDKNDQVNAKKHFDIPKDDFVIFFRSQLDFKGTEYIVEALKKMHIDKSITLLTCSEIGNLKEIENYYNVVELGNISTEELVWAYNACDLFLMPSIGESFGMMAIEAMACQRAVIIFNNTALPSVTHAPQCGVLVKNKDAKDLQEKIELLINDNEERNRRAKLGRNIVEDNYDLKKYYSEVRKLYEKVYSLKKANNIYDIKSSQDSNLMLVLNNLSKEIFKDQKNKYNYIKYPVKGKVKNKVDFSLLENQALIDEYNKKVYRLLLDDDKNYDGFKNFVKAHLNRESFGYKFLRKINRIIKRL